MRIRTAAALLLLMSVAACTGEPGERVAGPSSPPALATDGASPSAAESEPPDRHDDLNTLVAAYEESHPAPPADLRARTDELAARVDDLTDDELLVAVSRLTGGRDRDGHTGVVPLAQPNLRIWPLQLYEFDDGWRVIRAQAPYRDLIGGEVTAIAGRPVGAIKRMVAPLVSRDNAATVRGRLPQYVIVPALLRGLALKPSITVDGRQIDPKPISTEAYATWNDSFHPLVCPRLRPPDQPDWAVTRRGQAVIARYGLVTQTSHDQTIHSFAERLRRLARRTSGPVVIDVRDNPGGENGTYPPLLNAVQEIADQQPGRVRIVFGRCTFSAATNFVAEVLSSTDAVTFGEPMGGSPNMWGDADEYTLPASGIVLHVATVKWELGGRDRRPTIPPETPVPLSWADHRRGIDRALDAAVR